MSNPFDEFETALDRIHRLTASPPHRLTAEVARLRKALTSIRDIGLGPDRGSSQWQADCARSLARAALEATDDR